MLDRFALEQFSVRDASGRRFFLRYDELEVELGEGRWLTLLDALHEEDAKVRELKEYSAQICPTIVELDKIYDKIEAELGAYLRKKKVKAERITKETDPSKRIKLLGSYFTLNAAHRKLLAGLTRYMLAGSEIGRAHV